MVDPITKGATGAAVNSATGQDAATLPKVGESKFDKVRAGLQDRHAQGVEMPPEVKQISAEQHDALRTDLSNRLKTAPPDAAHHIFSADMKKATDGVNHLRTRINALPQTPAFQPFRDRLTSIDSQYQSAGKLLDSLKQGSNPQDLLKVQVQMYQLSENLELMSKVVEQMSSGMKTIFQTQV